jgi:hypothetical protein
MLILSGLLTACRPTALLTGKTAQIELPTKISREEGKSLIFAESFTDSQLVNAWYQGLEWQLAQFGITVLKGSENDASSISIKVEDFFMDEEVDTTSAKHASNEGIINIKDHFNFKFVTSLVIASKELEITQSKLNIVAVEEPVSDRRPVFGFLSRDKNIRQEKIERVGQDIFIQLAEVNGRLAGREIENILRKK